MRHFSPPRTIKYRHTQHCFQTCMWHSLWESWLVIGWLNSTGDSAKLICRYCLIFRRGQVTTYKGYKIYTVGIKTHIWKHWTKGILVFTYICIYVCTYSNILIDFSFLVQFSSCLILKVSSQTLVSRFLSSC